MEVKEFFAKLKQHCEKNGICEQCCLRLFCHIAPTAINDKIIDDVCLYINQSVEDITQHGTRGELHSNPSHLNLGCSPSTIGHKTLIILS